MKVIGISCITNFAAGMTDEEIDHDHVMETGAMGADIFKELLRRVIGKVEGSTGKAV
jgi:purine-nucleoside phosphorylase